MADEKKLTGFEDTGEQDNFGQILDFETPAKEEPKKEEPKKEEPKKEEKKEKEKGKGAGSPPPEDLEKELNFFGPTGPSGASEGATGATGAGGTGPTGPAEEEEDEFFKLPEEEQRAIENKEVEKKLQFSYTDLAKEIGIEGKFEDRSEYVAAVKKSIEDAKTKVEFDLSKLEENEQQLIKYFRSGGKVDDILNPTGKFDEFLAKTPEEKAIYWLMNERQIKEDEAKDVIEEMTDKGEFNKYVENIDKSVLAAKERERAKIIKAGADQYELSQTKLNEKAKEVRGALVKTAKDMETFMGMKIPDKIKNHIAAEIETGRFREVMDNPTAQIVGRLYMLFGDQILKNMEAKILEKNREGFNKGKDDVHADLHNIEQKEQGKRSVEETRRSVNDMNNPLAGFLTIDEDAVPGRD